MAFHEHGAISLSFFIDIMHCISFHWTPCKNAVAVVAAAAAERISKGSSIKIVAIPREFSIYKMDWIGKSLQSQSKVEFAENNWQAWCHHERGSRLGC
jgi:hypothetical protein